MKKFILSLVIGITLFFGAQTVSAGSAELNFTAPNQMIVGTEISVSIYADKITDISGGLSSLTFDLQFDDTHLEWVSSTAGSTIPGASYNESIHRYLFMDTSGRSGLTSRQVVYTFKFKVLKEATSTITATNVEGTDEWGDVATTNVVPITVSSQNASSNNNLASLSVAGHTLTPAFVATTTSYTVNVPWTTTSVNVAATVADSTASLAGVGNKNLNVGSNAVTITVTAQNGDSKTYTLNIIRAEDPRSTDNNLSSLSVEGYTLSPTFSANTTIYSVTVPNEITKVNVNATLADSNATMTTTGATSLNVGSNAITIRVTAENGTTKTYTINVTREADNRSHDTTLKNLVITNQTLTPVFNANTKEYSIVIPFEVNELEVLAEANHNLSTVVIAGNSNLVVGQNKITIEVTAENGDVDTYNINVTKQEEVIVEKSKDATLKNITIEGYTLNPEFESDITTYAINVLNEVNSINITAETNHELAKVEITGNTNFVVGINPVKIKVTAEDGTIKNYIVNVNKEGTTTVVATKSNDNYLKTLTIKGYEIEFDKNLNSYNIKVPFEITSLNIEYTLNDLDAKAEIVGNNGFILGMNTIEIEVTAEDGSIRVYTINAERSPLFSNNKLEEILLDNSLIKGFDPEVTYYDITITDIDSLDLKATALNEEAKVTIEGNSNLQEGNNTILIKVEDENGFVRYYTLDVYKEHSESLLYLILPWILFGIVVIIIMCVIIMIIASKKKNERFIEQMSPQPTIIEFKPEFNFGSKNGSENETNVITHEEVDKLPMKTVEAIYDDNVTKEEIIDAINNKDPETLKFLYDQEMLNRQKENLINKHKDDNNEI